MRAPGSVIGALHATRRTSYLPGGSKGRFFRRIQAVRQTGGSLPHGDQRMTVPGAGGASGGAMPQRGMRPGSRPTLQLASTPNSS